MKALRLFCGCIAASLVLGLAMQNTMAQTTNCTGSTSVHVAFIGSPTVINGGVLPSSGTDLTGITFANLAPANVNAATLAAFDTVELNVASAELNCNVANNLPAAAKAALIVWLAQGNKLIIHDSECTPQNYSWLPYPFTTSNPGQQGAVGTLVNLANDTLSSSDPSSPYYVNTAYVSQIGEVGDANVMTTLDPEWKIDMVATNILHIAGPTHTYAEYPSVSIDPNPAVARGLIIYNGLDTDQMATGTNALRKIYVLELRQPFNPSCIVTNISVVGIDLNPPSANACAGGTATVTARVHNQANQPVSGVLVTFVVASGPNAGAQATGVYNPATRFTDANGQVTFTYTSNGGLGNDVIYASFVDSLGHPQQSTAANVNWSCCTPPTIATTSVGNRGYYLLTASDGCFGSGGGSLQVYVKDSASAFVAGPFTSGTVVKIKRSIATGVGPSSGPASVTIMVNGDGQAYAADPVGDISPPATCKSL